MHPCREPVAQLSTSDSSHLERRLRHHRRHGQRPHQHSRQKRQQPLAFVASTAHCALLSGARVAIAAATSAAVIAIQTALGGAIHTTRHTAETFHPLCDHDIPCRLLPVTAYDDVVTTSPNNPICRPTAPSTHRHPITRRRASRRSAPHTHVTRALALVPPSDQNRVASISIPVPKLPNYHLPFLPRSWLATDTVTIDPAVVAKCAELRRIAIEAWDIFRDRYVDNQHVDWDRMRRKLDQRKITNERELHAAIDWMLSHANDQFTRFLPQSELSAMKDDIDGEMCGVGIVFTAETYGWRRTKRVIVKEVVRHSPAADAGLSRGDEITAIDTHNIRRMSVDEATNRLLGKQGQKVSISFIRCDDRVEMSVTLTRRRFTVPTVSGEVVIVPGVGRVSFIQVREFAANTGLQARRTVRRILRSGPVNMYVLDLRGNSGGLVDQAVEFARVFLDRNHVVVRFVGRDGANTVETSGARWFWRQRVRVLDEPIVVLVDEATASASELVAASLRDNCRAVIVGAATYGKGSVQAIAQLSDGSGVAVTVAQYRTPANRPIITGRGLKPDLFKSGIADDVAAVNQLLSNSPRRLRWIRTRLSSCTPPAR